MITGAGACTSAPDTPPPSDVLPSYAVTYRIEANDVISFEEHLVRRPYEARTIFRRDGEIISGRMTNLDGSWVFSRGTEPGWLRLEVGPRRAAPDPRPLPVLDRAREAGLLEVLGTDRVLDHSCTLVRTGGGTDEDLAPPSPDEHAEVCIDEDGIVLSEIRVRKGEVARTMEATLVDPAPEIGGDAFVPSPLTGGGPPLDGDAPSEDLDAGLRVSLEAPHGFAYDGASQKLVAAGSFGGIAGSGVLQRYVRGVELLELDHSPSSSRGGPNTTTVDLPGIGRAILTLDLRVSSLHVPLGDDVAVRLLAADPDLLIPAAQGLDRVR